MMRRWQAGLCLACVLSTPATLRAEAAAGEETGAALRAYHAALAAKRLDAGSAASAEQLAVTLAEAEAKLALGRRDEAIALLAGVVESPRFQPLSGLDEGRAVVFTLGTALARAGAYAEARSYLRRLLQEARPDTWLRRAVASLVDIGLESGQLDAVLADVRALPPGPDQPWSGDERYLSGRALEAAGKPEEALRAYAGVPQNSRFWAQANYRSGLVHVEQRRYAKGEQCFCKIADPRQTPKVAPLFGGKEFFEVRDLSRLALGRVAHEQYRFDDAGYYYHLVPGDSRRLPEALYESATSRYEAKDYEAAERLLAELDELGQRHSYEDEAAILSAYVDLGRCQFPRADARLKAFLAKYEPVLDATRRLKGEPRALRALLTGAAPGARQGAGNIGFSMEVSELIATSIRVDRDYGSVARRLSDVEHQLLGLEAARRELSELSAHLAAPGATRARPEAPLADSQSDRLRRLGEQTSALRRQLREAGTAGVRGPELAALKSEITSVEAELERLAPAEQPRLTAGEGEPSGDALVALLVRDAREAAELAGTLRRLSASLEQEQDRLGLAALERLERRLTRLVRRARAGRIETVLGKKRALEIEVEALSQGFLPRGAVDSLDAARHLADDEEYWPFDGEDWDDEYMGGEGLR